MGLSDTLSVVIVLYCYLPICSGQDFSRVAFPKGLQPQQNEAGQSRVPLNFADEAGVYAKTVELLSQYWRSNLPPEVVKAVQTAVKEEQSLNASRDAGSESSNSTCFDGWMYLGTHWSVTIMGFNLSLAVQAVDAFGKPGAGIFEGNLIALGSYDECLSIDHTQYCLVPLFASDIGAVRVGMCLPRECTKQDIVSATNDINNILRLLNVSLAVYTEPTVTYCESEKELPYNAGAIVMILVCSLFALLVLVGTAIDWLLDFMESTSEDSQPVNVNSDLENNVQRLDEQSPLLGKSSTVRTLAWKNALPVELITAFSLFKTVPTILSTKQPPAAITCVHGMRVISMCWVILGHTHAWALTESGLSNTGYVLKDVVTRFTYQPIANGFLSVDSFFFLSGLLIAYLTLRHMTRKNGRFPAVTYYVHRYLRLTPSYAFVLFFYWFLTMHLTDGPAYHFGTGVHSVSYGNCEKYWWTNLLYINNLYPWSMQDECMGWTWYLANDMQFFVVSPLLIVLLYYWPIVGLLSVGIFLAGSFAATGAITGYYQFDASFLGLADANSPINFMDEIYEKPYARISPYLVGIVAGFLLFKKVKFSLRRLPNWFIHVTLWVLAASLGMVVVYGLYDTWHGHTLSTAEDVMYITFSRFTWGVALALVVFVCHNGYGWVINSFLSMKFWIPLSRLSFNAYLVHEIVLTVIYGNLRNPVYYTDITLSVFTVAAVVIAYATAGVVAVFVEFPLGAIEGTVFKMLGLSARESTRHVHVANTNLKVADLQRSPPESARFRKNQLQHTNASRPGATY